MKKIIGIIAQFIQIVLIVALVVIALTSFGTKVPFLARLGLNFFAVTSGSMEPAIPTGSLIYSGRYAIDNLKEGDIVTYQVQSLDTQQHLVVTHRIQKVTKTEEVTSIGEGEEKTEKRSTKYEFVTKGDANAEADSQIITFSNIIGLYKWHVPYFGYVTSFAQTQQGFISLVILPAFILIIWEVISLVLHFRNEFKTKAEKEVAALKAELRKQKDEED